MAAGAGAQVNVSNVRQVRTTIDEKDPIGGPGSEVLFAIVQPTTAASNQAFVAAVPKRSIRVLSVNFTATAAGTFQLLSGTTNVFGPVPFATTWTALGASTNPNGLCTTTAGAALQYTTTGTVTAGVIQIAYVLV